MCSVNAFLNDLLPLLGAVEYILHGKGKQKKKLKKKHMNVSISLKK